MASERSPSTDIEGVVRFHGHWCPGLATGIRVAEVALQEIGPHSTDEEVVAIVETDNCAVDAIQYFTGCTFGKGNLIHRDHGKNAFTFIRRSDGKAVRVVSRPDAWPPSGPAQDALYAKVREQRATEDDLRQVEELRQERMEAIMSRPLEELFEIREVTTAIPEKARIHESIVCSACGESAMETRIRLFRGQPYCIPCFEALDRRVG
jgi:formylmethanofuran dehydrogenase subunit E